MTDTRVHPVASATAHAQAVGDYRAHGYTVRDEGDGETTLETYSRGGLLTHLALFFTVGWLTFGLLNVWYARRSRKQSHDRVRVVTR